MEPERGIKRSPSDIALMGSAGAVQDPSRWPAGEYDEYFRAGLR